MPLCRPHRAPVAQLDRASDYESEGRTFESFRARHSFFDERFGPSWSARGSGHSGAEGDSSVQDDSVTVGGALGEFLGQLGVPVAGLLSHGALRGHAFFNRPAMIIAVIGFHRRLQLEHLIPRIENVPKVLSDGKYPHL